MNPWRRWQYVSSKCGKWIIQWRNVTFEKNESLCIFNYSVIKVQVKWSRYRPGVAQRVGRGIALLFHDRGTRREWVVSSTPRPHYTPGKDPVPIVQEAGWAPGPVWMGGKFRPHRDEIPDRPARSQMLYQLSYSDHKYSVMETLKLMMLICFKLSQGSCKVIEI